MSFKLEINIALYASRFVKILVNESERYRLPPNLIAAFNLLQKIMKFINIQTIKVKQLILIIFQL